MSDDTPGSGAPTPPEKQPGSPSGAPRPAIPPPPVAAPPPPPPEEPSPEPPVAPAAAPAGDGSGGRVSVADEPPAAPPASNEKTLAMLCHLLSLTGLLFFFLNIISPLILWLVKKADVPRVDEEGRRSVNFQATVTVAALVLFVLIKLFGEVPILGILTTIVGWLALVALGIADIVFVVLATIQVNNGKPGTYPYAYDFIKLFAPKGEASDED